MHTQTYVRGVFLGAAVFFNPTAMGDNATTSIQVDARINRHAINPNIYGVSFASSTALSDLNAPLNRSGGNTTSRYNWQANAYNHAADWYFESVPESSATAGESGDTFVSTSKTAGAQAMLTIPMVGWVAKLGSNRAKLASFSVSRYGAQTDTDKQWYADAGNGVSSSTGKNITGNNPGDANVAADSSYQKEWVTHLVSRWGAASAGGLKYYLLDNEPGLWHETHRDVHPTGATMDEVRSRMIDYATKVKAADPSALVVGPEEWGWSGYFYSGYDLQYGAAHGWSYLPDRTNHGNWDMQPWLLDQLRQNNASTGKRLLDVFSLHYYPQGGEFSDDVSSNMQLLRNRSTRSLWDPNYTDESWIDDEVQLIPRMKGWVNTYYPSTQTAITEYNWGAENSINGATAQADVLGIFGREGLDMATRWGTPASTTPTYKAMKLFRNYDGQKSGFGDTSVLASVPNPDNVSAFAAVRTSDGALTLMVISKYLSGTTPITLSLSNFQSSGSAQVWQLTSSNTITHPANLSVTQNVLSTSVPAQSITLFVLPPAPTTITFSGTTTAKPSTLSPGAVTTLSSTLTCTKGTLSSGLVDLEIYSPSGAQVFQKTWTAQSFTTGQARTYSYSWTAPSTAGLYTVKVGVFASNGQPTYYWNSAAAQVTVTGATSSDSAQYNFETSTQAWTTSGGMLTQVSSSSAQIYAGARSLAVAFNGTAADKQMVSVASPGVTAGKTISFRVWIPSGSKISAVQPYVLQNSNWTWTGAWTSISSLKAGAWNTLNVVVPSSATTLYSLGVEFTTSAAWTGTCYVDAVSWSTSQTLVPSTMRRAARMASIPHARSPRMPS